MFFFFESCSSSSMVHLFNKWMWPKAFPLVGATPVPFRRLAMEFSWDQQLTPMISTHSSN